MSEIFWNHLNLEIHFFSPFSFPTESWADLGTTIPHIILPHTTSAPLMPAGHISDGSYWIDSLCQNTTNPLLNPAHTKEGIPGLALCFPTTPDFAKMLSSRHTHNTNTCKTIHTKPVKLNAITLRKEQEEGKLLCWPSGNTALLNTLIWESLVNPPPFVPNQPSPSPFLPTPTTN